MDVNFINPFISSIQETFAEFYELTIKKEKLELKKFLVVNKDVTVFSSLIGEVKCNIAYSMNSELSNKLIELFLDTSIGNIIEEVKINTINEILNIINNKAVESLKKSNHVVEISNPTTIMGGNMNFIISNTKTFSILLTSEIGNLEVIFGIGV